jgi:hypothetical protein
MAVDALEDLPLPTPADLREPEAWPTAEEIADFLADESAGMPRPVRGGAPEPEPFEPSEEDLADYRAHFDAEDTLYCYGY